VHGLFRFRLRQLERGGEDIGGIDDGFQCGVSRNATAESGPVGKLLQGEVTRHTTV
jgi:hypothetical protein